MDCGYNIEKFKAFLDSHFTLYDIILSDNTSKQLLSFKKDAYHLFYELIKLHYPQEKRQVNPVYDLFEHIKLSLETNSIELKVVKKIESWWLEWLFALEVDQQLVTEINNTPLSFIPQNTLNPMRKHELSHYAKLFSVLPMPVCNICAITGEILKVNQRFIDVLGYTIEDIPNLNVWCEKAYPDCEYREQVKQLWYESIKKAIEENKAIPTNNYKIMCKDGVQITMEVSAIDIGDEYLAIFNDATERLEAESILRDMAFRDSLTQIANRRRFDEKLNHEFQRAEKCGGALSIIIIDIDFFKQFNDRYGHVAGDTCIYKVAQTIAGVVNRPEDFVARYGGEEFVVLLPDTDTQGALFIAECIQKSIEHAAIVHKDSFTGFLSVSMGINTAEEFNTSDEKNFIEQADSALYYAKSQGRNCIAIAPR